MYPRMLELDRQRGWETQTSYYYRYLNDRSIKYLAEILGIPFNNLEDRDFTKFKREAAAQNYDHGLLLLKVWDKYRHKSVTSRGHHYQDMAAVVLVVIFYVAIILYSKLGCFN